MSYFLETRVDDSPLRGYAERLGLVAESKRSRAGCSGSGGSTAPGHDSTATHANTVRSLYAKCGNKNKPCGHDKTCLAIRRRRTRASGADEAEIRYITVGNAKPPRDVVVSSDRSAGRLNCVAAHRIARANMKLAFSQGSASYRKVLAFASDPCVADEWHAAL